MRLEKYTLDVRECRAKRGARRERTNITKTGKMQSIFPERVSAKGGPRKCLHFWGSEIQLYPLKALSVEL